MTSRVRHRRTPNPATPFPTIEPGEIAVNTANRQIAVGDAKTASPGIPKPLIAVRFFDVEAQYAANEMVVQAGGLYKSKTTISPGAFDSSQWDLYVPNAGTLAYINAQDAAIIAAYEAADTDLQTQIDNKVARTGDTMSGPLNLPGLPSVSTHAANKQYVDNAVSTGGVTSLPGTAVTITPVGGVSSTNAQAAIAELEAEKATLASPNFTGIPTAPTPPPNDNDNSIATTAFVAGQAGTSMPAMDGTPVAGPGTSIRYARDDHVHPNDATKAPLDSPAFVGVPTAPTAPPGTSTNQIATTAFALSNALADGSVTFAKMANSALATVAQFLANVPNKLLVSDKIWAAAVPIGLADAGSVAPDFAQGIDFVWVISTTGRALANPANPKPGQKGVIYLVQPATGGATITTWGTMYKFSGGVKPVLSTANNAIDLISYAVKSPTEVICFFSRGMA